MSWWGSHEVKEFKAHLLILEALKQAIDQLWWPRLPLIQLVLAKCNAVGWDTDTIVTFLWPLVWRLFSGISTTKTTQEDILQELTNLRRQNRRKDISLTRTMFCAATSKRLSALPCAMLKCQKGDLLAHGKRFKVVVDDFLPRKYNQPADEGSQVVAKAISYLRENPTDQDISLNIKRTCFLNFQLIIYLDGSICI